MEGLHGHFQDQRVETHMYSSQWFLTIFTAKFPIAMVFRIMDLYLCEVRLLATTSLLFLLDLLDCAFCCTYMCVWVFLYTVYMCCV